MQKYPAIPWLRILAEGTTIVVSILLAFAIDAWWQRQAEQEQANALITGLHADFSASQSHLKNWLAGNEKILKNLTAFRDQMAAAETDAEIVVPGEWIVAAMGAPTYSPTDATVEAAISSGHLDLIKNAELRNLLATWRQLIIDTGEDEVLIRQIVVNHLIPLISAQIRLGQVLRTEVVVDWFHDRADVVMPREVQLRATSELEAALSQRIFYTNFVVWGLTELDQVQGQILRLLAAETELNG